MNLSLPAPSPALRIARNWKYLLSLVPLCIVVAGNLIGGPWAYANFVFTFILLAIAEQLLGDEKSNAFEPDATLPNLVLGLHVVGQVASVGSLLYGVAAGNLIDWVLLGAILSTGTHSGTSSIVIAHELVHRRQAYWRRAAKFLLYTVSNPYFFVEHVRVHHKLVATPEDPATARRGESLYAFFLRTIPMQLGEVLRLEAQRLRKLGAAPYSPRNYAVGALLMAALTTAALALAFGPWVGLAFLAQGLLASFLLEFTNYIEHYGLHRDKLQRVNETHSWQSDRIVSRYMLVDLSRHSDHHFHGAKPYHTLLHYPESPELPYGYAGMFPLALLPPLFFRVMDRQLAAYQQRQATSDAA